MSTKRTDPVETDIEGKPDSCIPFDRSLKVSRILVVQGKRVSSKLIQALRSSSKGEVSHAHRLESALEMLQIAHYDAVLFGVQSPDRDGRQSLERIKMVAPQTAVLFLTGDDIDWIVHATIRRGFQEYHVRRRVRGASLQSAVQYAVEKVRPLEGEFSTQVFPPWLACRVDGRRGNSRPADTAA